VGHDLAMVLGSPDGEVGRRAKAEHDLPVVRYRPAVPRDVQIANPGREPGVGAHERLLSCRLLGVLDPADPDLAQVVPPGPGEVTDHVVVGLHLSPQLGDLQRERLGTDDYPVGVQLVVELVAAEEVVVARHVDSSEGLRRPLVDHVLAQHGRQDRPVAGEEGVDTAVLVRA
jgi:hypothetical protein